MRYQFPYFISIPMVICMILGAYAGGIAFYALPILAFGFMPFADAMAGQSRWPSKKALERITSAQARWYEVALISAGSVTLLALVWGLYVASRWTLTAWELGGLALSVGLITGYSGIVTAHEMMHRDSRAYRLFAWILMSAVIYPHYPVEHVLSHHHKFGTHEDAATARRGETVYAFIPRAIFVGLINALKLRPLPVVAAYICTAIGLAAIYLFLGTHALIFTILQGLFAAFLLEATQYVQHYGLVRRKLPNGRYESPGPELSWDTSNLLTNVNLFNLARHSDHHSFSRRPYYRLRHNDAAPQLPYGYAAMFLVALIPPLWLRMMDRRVDDWNAGLAERRRDGHDAGREPVTPR